ncbi:zinc ABC transporter substrate-binding protein [uncultured Arcobacter sp.]|uniref:metal ABC transporter solute-binding protein, Zn/Mn family n=1 Tax=uncultured Arcobacter sp. TaxID=165434 RepID=UPI00260DC45A|nr:zinc ABC transporter substrate-binding protein [uncultured Arcobacter sp.]
MRKIFIISLLLLSSLYAQKIVTVSILPQKYFIEKIAMDKVFVNVMVQPGASPASYEPKTSQMKDLINSEIYFSIGVPFEEAWLGKFKDINKNMQIIDSSKGIKKIAIAQHHHEGEVHHHNEEILDPHIWLDPILVKVQAKNILDALVQIDKKNRNFYYDNYKNFLFELDALHLKLSTILKEVKGKRFMVFHPSWGYFAKRYELEQEAVEKEGKEPKSKEIIALINEAKEEGIKVVFVAPQFSKKSAEIIANGIGGKTIFIDPLSNKWKESLLNTSIELVNSYK